MEAMKRGRYIADRALTIAVLVSVGFVGYASYYRWLRPPTPVTEPLLPVPQEPLSVDGLVTVGSAAAPLALIVYTDFLCAACGTFASQTLPRLLTEYVKPGRVLLALRFISNGATKPLAYKVAQAGRCAHEQGRFWPVHDDLFKRGPILSDDQLGLTRLEEILLDVARAAELTEDEFRTCLASPTVRQTVFQDAGSGLFLGVRATPSLFIGRLRDGRLVEVTSRVQGAMTPDALGDLLDDLQASSFHSESTYPVAKKGE
jgi:protein-disulfide isomerase